MQYYIWSSVIIVLDNVMCLVERRSLSLRVVGMVVVYILGSFLVLLA
jgi:hypothetical protein